MKIEEIQERRDWKILSRGEVQADTRSTTDFNDQLWRLIPERKRLVAVVTATEVVWLAMQVIVTLRTRTSTVCYLPGHERVDGATPVKYARLVLGTQLPVSDRASWKSEYVKAAVAVYGFGCVGHVSCKSANKLLWSCTFSVYAHYLGC